MRVSFIIAALSVAILAGAASTPVKQADGSTETMLKAVYDQMAIDGGVGADRYPLVQAAAVRGHDHDGIAQLVRDGGWPCYRRLNAEMLEQPDHVLVTCRVRQDKPDLAFYNLLGTTGHSRIYEP